MDWVTRIIIIFSYTCSTKYPDVNGYFKKNPHERFSKVRHCGLVESARTWDGTGCEFDSWQCRIYIISHVHRAYDYSKLGSFRGSLSTYGLIQKLCRKNELSSFQAWFVLKPWGGWNKIFDSARGWGQLKPERLIDPENSPGTATILFNPRTPRGGWCNPP